MLKARISKAVRGNVGTVSRCRIRRRRPKFSVFLVADVEGFACNIAYRIVAPGCYPILMSVQRPGIGCATLRHNRAETTVGDDVYPGGRRCVFSLGLNLIFCTIGREPAVSVEKKKIGRQPQFFQSPFWPGSSDFHKGRQTLFS